MKKVDLLGVVRLFVEEPRERRKQEAVYINRERGLERKEAHRRKDCFRVWTLDRDNETRH